jgi:hypothetical protein
LAPKIVILPLSCSDPSVYQEKVHIQNFNFFSKIFLDFWFENKPSGNPAHQPVRPTDQPVKNPVHPGEHSCR